MVRWYTSRIGRWGRHAPGPCLKGSASAAAGSSHSQLKQTHSCYEIYFTHGSTLTFEGTFQVGQVNFNFYLPNKILPRCDRMTMKVKFLHVLQANLDMTASMRPGKLVRHMQNLSYTYMTHTWYMQGTGTKHIGCHSQKFVYSGPSYPSSPEHTCTT